MTNNTGADTSHVDTDRVDPEQWVDEYGDYLYRYAYSRLRDASASEEVVQETFLSGIRYHDQYSGRGAERGWLLGILKRKIIDYIRKRSKHARTGSFEDQTDPSEMMFDEQGNWRNDPKWLPPDRELESSELREVVQGCLKHLPKGQADVFVLSVMENLESDEICRELGITPSNYWVRLHRARLGLANCVSSRWLIDEEGQKHAQRS